MFIQNSGLDQIIFITKSFKAYDHMLRLQHFKGSFFRGLSVPTSKGTPVFARPLHGGNLAKVTTEQEGPAITGLAGASVPHSVLFCVERRSRRLSEEAQLRSTPWLATIRGDRQPNDAEEATLIAPLSRGLFKTEME